MGPAQGRACFAPAFRQIHLDWVSSLSSQYPADREMKHLLWAVLGAISVHPPLSQKKSGRVLYISISRKKYASARVLRDSVLILHTEEDIMRIRYSKKKKKKHKRISLFLLL